MRRVSLNGFAIAVALAACATTSAPASHAEADVLKNWALCRCIGKAAHNEPFGDDASKSAAAYLEQGSGKIETYQRIDALVDSYLARKYTGSVPSSYQMMKCIDLFRSRELERVASAAVEANAAPEAD
jgi:hypothetical protein